MGLDIHIVIRWASTRAFTTLHTLSSVSSASFFNKSNDFVLFHKLLLYAKRFGKKFGKVVYGNFLIAVFSKVIHT